ncbi:E3 ubiquitin-protein ligase RNF169 [Astyanax mexicanus]|uniref:RING-type E3 ubiquitin transferase n=2 Tax=Astyanax mexicanus TaxID=7994 RepID=A0A8T2L6S9_ASTMX|nr:E3 ubiquitin-protein ligase RNF169 [Astyanax mexicanus]
MQKNWAGFVFKPSSEIPMKMAATGCAKSAGGLEQRSQPGLHLPARSLTLEEARCPVCQEILLEPVTMPCGHSVCLHCFRRTVQLSTLCCPLCRLRVSSWARKQSREKSLVNTELWEKVRQSYPERCRRRIEQRDGATAGEDVFRSPTQIYKAGEVRQEYEKQKIKVAVEEETEERKKKMPHHRKEECGLLYCHDSSFGVLSDSENKEPIGMRTRHVSAFVRKTRLSPASNRSFQNSVVQRSRSCTDSEEGRGKNRAQSHISVPEKAGVTHSFNAGILLSSENSRSFSAPVLPLDKRHHWRAILASPPTSLVPHSKPERSISPESNDSISEELNHFKPIVCSPCTPPKRLPDGRLMEPTIVKSTPRNLTQSLQKTTSYEASPTILQKWKQIEVDRQCIRVTSKGTITSPVADDLTVKQSSGEETEGKSCNCVPVEKDRQGQQLACNQNTVVHGKKKEKLSNKRRLIFDQCSREGETQSVTANAVPALITLDSSDVHKSHNACKAQGEVFKSPVSGKHAGVSHCNQGTEDLQDLNETEPTVKSCVPNRPTSRRGKKRSQKTKHLELTGKIKISRTESCDPCEPQQGDRHFYTVAQMHQERKDRELALKLQRQYDKECQMIERHKTSSDKYSLRSWASTGSRAVRNPRRSGRISGRLKHFQL